MKYSLDSDDTYFYMDMTNSLVDDFVQDMVVTVPFEYSLDDPKRRRHFPCF